MATDQKPILSGAINDDAGYPIATIAVQAFNRDLRSQELLGTAVTDADGRYEITYKPVQFVRAEKASADLQVRALAADGKTVLATSDILFNAPPQAEINLTIPLDRLHTDSEWERYGRILAPLLGFAKVPDPTQGPSNGTQPLPPHELTDDDLAFLHGETSIALDHLRAIRLAAQWWQQHQNDKALPADGFYGLLRQGLSGDWKRMLSSGPNRWRAALKQAMADRQVPANVAARVDMIVARLETLAVDLAFEPPKPDVPYSSMTRPIGALLAAAPIDNTTQRRAVTLLLNRKPADDPAQWWTLLAQQGLAPQAVAAVRFAVEADALLDGQLPTLRALQSLVAKDFGTASDLAQLTSTQWQELSTEVARKGGLPVGVKSPAAYAQSLANRVEQAFPTHAIAHHLALQDDPLRRDVGTLLLRNPTFDLRSGVVNDFMQTAELGDIKTPKDALQAHLAAQARMAKLAPADGLVAGMDALGARGYDSAFKVTAVGRVAFLRDVGAQVHPAVARAMYFNASQQAGDLVMQTLRLRDPLTAPSPVLAAAVVKAGSALARFTDMFGGGNACVCESCESALGPAAYLLDLFEFLSDMDASAPVGGQSLREVLFERRPDLQHLALNCANALTPLPYIDLVIELLERQITGVWTAASTPQTPEQLANGSDVAAHLRAAPYEMPDPPPALADLYGPAGPLATAQYPWNLPFERDHEQAGLYLRLMGVSPAEAIALGMDDDNEAFHRARLGIVPSVWSLLHGTPAEGARPSGIAVAKAWGFPGRANALEALHAVGGNQGLLARSGLTPSELFTLIQSPPFQEWRLTVVPLRPDLDACDVDALVLRRILPTGPDPRELGSEQVRIFDLMHRVLRLRHALGWPLGRLIAALDAMAIGKTQPRIDLVTFSRLDVAAASLNLQVADLARMLRALDGPPAEEVARTQARLEWLQALGLSAEQHRYLVDLGMPDTMRARTGSIALPERLRELRDVVSDIRLMQAAGLDAAELRYLLQHVDVTPGAFAPGNDQSAQQLEALLSPLRKLAADLPPLAAGASADEIEAHVQKLLPQVAGTLKEHLQQITGFDDVAAVVAGLARLDPASPTPPDPVLLSRVPLVQTLVQWAVSGQAAASRLATKANQHLQRVLKATRLLSMLGLTGDDVRALAKLQAAGVVWFDFNTLPVAPAGATGERNLGWADLRLLVSASLARSVMPAGRRGLFNLIAQATSSATAIDLLVANTGWGQSIAPAPEQAPEALARMVGTLQFADTTWWQDPSAYSKLHAATTWMQQRGLHASRGADDLQTVLATATSVSVSAVQLQDITRLARARFGSLAQWPQAVTPLMDRLRSRHRDALLKHLMHLGSAGSTPDEVYAHLLIDVQMGACQLTSRIVQAHSAVQLFVQRCIMNLETQHGVVLGDVSGIEEWRQWEWMKSYRVWEAARKVFFYPENWLEPDLRVGKTPLFEALENDLRQDEVTPPRIERVVQNYLHKLHEVSRLDIRTLYEQTWEERQGDGSLATKTVLHLVGRTRAQPHRYHYCKRLDDRSWTPWEPLDVNIEGDHLLLVVHEGRPLLFWPKFREVQKPGDRSTPPQINTLVSLNWSEQVQGAWSAPRTSEKSIRVRDDADKRLLLLRSDQSDGKLRIRLHVRHTTLTLNAELRAMSPTATEPEHLDADRQNATLRVPCATREFDAGGCSGDLNTRPVTSTDRWWIQFRVPENVVLDDGGWVTNDGSVYLQLKDWQAYARSREIEFYAMDEAARVFESFHLRGTKLIPVHQAPEFTLFQPFVFIDGNRQYVAAHRVEYQEYRIGFAREVHSYDYYEFTNFYHPYTCAMLQSVRAGGLTRLYRPPETEGSGAAPAGSDSISFARQLTSEPDASVFRQYQPSSLVWTGSVWGPESAFPREQFEFAPSAVYARYNWELFFHVPLLLAKRLQSEGRFAEAQQWLHCVFDPTDVSAHGSPQKYWRVKPLFLEGKRWSAAGEVESLEAMLRALSAGDADLESQVQAWRNDPFDPHRIAHMRLAAYMKNVVQRYAENLLAWGDNLFRRDTMESINEATQLYTLAQHVLGEDPVLLPRPARAARSYADLSATGPMDELANRLVSVEDFQRGRRPAAAGSRLTPRGSTLYFCIPGNPRLAELRATARDRLFKIRHCMNLDGRTRQLALFAPPIDPGLLVRARAAGMDIGRAIELALAPQSSPYRFTYLLAKALEFTNEVRAFGNALLSALEKKDGEALAQLRSAHEVATLKRVAVVRRQQVEEAQTSLQALQQARRSAEIRQAYYTSREYMNGQERGQVANMTTAHLLQLYGQEFGLLAAVAHMFPDVKVGMDGGPTFGGRNVGDTLTAIGGAFDMVASHYSFKAGLSGLMGGHDRRRDEWALQADLASQELRQMDEQILAAEIRLSMAQAEERHQEQQTAESEAFYAAQREKFTNAQLYDWMAGQLSALHYQSYRMASDLARQAESAACDELDKEASAPKLIGLDHWDAGRKGLLAGERLAQDLRRLELAYMQANTRRLELSTHLSLRRIDAIALMNLRATGECIFTLPHDVFEMDFPQLGNRRIKSVSVSVPGVVGPYTGVHGILRLESPTGAAATSLIATSTGQNDAGVFQLDFRDERYLPFEGTRLDSGTSTAWRFTLPKKPAFDYDTISDLVLHVQYTALPAGPEAPRAPTWSRGNAPGDRTRFQLIDIRHDFPDAWRLLQADPPPEGVRIELHDQLFPYRCRPRHHQTVLMPAGVIVEPIAAGAAAFMIEKNHLKKSPTDHDRHADRENGDQPCGFLVVRYEVDVLI